MEQFIISFLSKIPFEMIMAIVATVLLTEGTKSALAKLEVILEEKKGKQIKFFDHTKIIFVIVYALIATICLVIANVINWLQYPLYAFSILGASTTCYELIIKKVKNKVEQSKGE